MLSLPMLHPSLGNLRACVEAANARREWFLARMPITGRTTLGIACQRLRSSADGLVAEHVRDGTARDRRAQIRQELQIVGQNWRLTCPGIYGDIVILFRPKQTLFPKHLS